MWVEGERYGQGKYSASIGDVYEGEYVAGKKHGRGKMTYAAGGSYEGEYAEDKKHGKGTFTFALGASYAGEYAEGKKHGKGTYTNADGSSYEGEWAEGKYKHGNGTTPTPAARWRSAATRRTPTWGRASSGVRTGQRGVGAAGRRGGARHPAGRGGPDRRADRAVPPP